MEKIPASVIAVVAEELGAHYTHTALNTLFEELGAPGEPPEGNKVDKCRAWLTRVNTLATGSPLEFLGDLIAELMEFEPAYNWPESLIIARKATADRITRQLGRHGLAYVSGGRVVGSHVQPTARTLTGLIEAHDLAGVKSEFERAFSQLESDPAAAVTAACALLEATFTHILELADSPVPSDRSVASLWKLVRELLGFDPEQHEDDHLRRVLGSLATIVQSIGEIRTRAGSAHGGSARRYRLQPRHARMVVSSAATLAIFCLETLFEKAR